MSNAKVENSNAMLTPLARAGYALATIWIFGGAAYFFLRFSQAVYRAHESSIDQLIAGISRALGVGGFDS